MNLTTSLQNYIKAIYELSSNIEGVRISDIAAKLKVTKASTCRAMKALQEKKLIDRDKYKQVILTQKGRHQAILLMNKYTTIHSFLVEVLNVKQEIADADACAMEHILSMETLSSLNKFVSGKDLR